MLAESNEIVICNYCTLKPHVRQVIVMNTHLYYVIFDYQKANDFLDFICIKSIINVSHDMKINIWSKE